MNVDLYPLLNIKPHAVATGRLSADAWCTWLWADVLGAKLQIDFTIWLPGPDIYDPESLNSNPHYAVLRASDLKGQHFQLPHWHPERIRAGKELEAVVEGLGDDSYILATYL